MDASRLNRRAFLKWTGAVAATTAIGATPLAALASSDYIQLTILHTNDVHSRIEPFPMDGGRYQGLGGAARRATLIEQIRQKKKNVLLLDAGDMVQGTPYFNLFGGQPEMELMSRMKYDATTLGNHEFDNGPDGLLYMLQYARFPVVIANYDLGDTVLKGKTKEYTIIKKQGIRIGVFGLGIDLAGLVDPLLHQDVQYLDPIATANTTARRLRHDYKCNFVICLSHLGYRYGNSRISDAVLASQSRNIDLIIGGHTHSFMPQPEQVANLDGRPTTINQVGFGGIMLGRLDYIFERRTGKSKLLVGDPFRISTSRIS